MKTTKLMRKKRHIMLPEWLLLKVEKEAAGQGFDFSGQLTRLCERWIDAGCPKSFSLVSPLPAPRSGPADLPVDLEAMQMAAAQAAAALARGR